MRNGTLFPLKGVNAYRKAAYQNLSLTQEICVDELDYQHIILWSLNSIPQDLLAFCPNEIISAKGMIFPLQVSVFASPQGSSLEFDISSTRLTCFSYSDWIEDIKDMVQMVDIERVVTLDELMDRVPEHLVREAESNRNELMQQEFSPSFESNKMSKEPSKAQRIRAFMESNPQARNKDIVKSLEKYGVKAADVANVKAHIKRVSGDKTPRKRGPAPVSSSPASATTPSGGFPNVNLKHLEAAVDFVKLVGSIQEAQHLLIIVERVKNA